MDLFLPASKVASITESGYTVLGKDATMNEYYVALALEHEKIPFMFQYWYSGGQDVLGGYVLDFVVINPFYVPLEVFGNYWHTGQMVGTDRLKLAVIAQAFRREAIIIWGTESTTYELALDAVRRKVE